MACSPASSRPLRSRRFFLDMAMRPVFNVCPEAPREASDNPFNACLENPGLGLLVA